MREVFIRQHGQRFRCGLKTKQSKFKVVGCAVSALKIPFFAEVRISIFGKSRRDYVMVVGLVCV